MFWLVHFFPRARTERKKKLRAAAAAAMAPSSRSSDNDSDDTDGSVTVPFMGGEGGKDETSLGERASVKIETRYLSLAGGDRLFMALINVPAFLIEGSSSSSSSSKKLQEEEKEQFEGYRRVLPEKTQGSKWI